MKNRNLYIIFFNAFKSTDNEIFFYIFLQDGQNTIIYGQT